MSLNDKQKDVLMLLIKGWRKLGRGLSADEIAEYLDVSRSTVTSRFNVLSCHGYMSNDHQHRPLKDIHGNELEMRVEFICKHQKNLDIDPAQMTGASK